MEAAELHQNQHPMSPDSCDVSDPYPEYPAKVSGDSGQDTQANECNKYSLMSEWLLTDIGKLTGGEGIHSFPGAWRDLLQVLYPVDKTASTRTARPSLPPQTSSFSLPRLPLLPSSSFIYGARVDEAWGPTGHALSMTS